MSFAKLSVAVAAVFTLAMAGAARADSPPAGPSFRVSFPTTAAAQPQDGRVILLISRDLTRVPRLAELFAYRVKGINPWDFIALKELSLNEGEIVGRVGVVL